MWFLLLAGLPGWAQGTQPKAADREPAHVLVLLSYHHGHSWEDDILHGLEAWDGAPAERPILHVEWMDTKRYASAEYRARYQRFLEEKYADRRFDLIATVDDIALEHAVNAYAGSVKSYYGWEKKGKEVELDLQHVVRLGYEVNEGISDVFPKQINSGDAFSHTIELNLPKNIQNYKNLKLIAFVIDRNSKYVENVVEVPIKEMQPTETAIRDINNVETPAITFLNGYIDALDFDGKISVYTVDGKAVANTNLKPGMYIVRLTKGKQTFVKKIVL
jgi:hypothetical protein